METIILISLVLWALFFLWNYSLLLNNIRRALSPVLDNPNLEAVKYILSCSFCFPFWITLGCMGLVGWPVYYPLVVAPIVHYLDLIYNRISDDKTTDDK